MSAPSVCLLWTETQEWDCQFSEVEWARLVEEMDSDLPTDVSAGSVATVKEWMRANGQVCEEVLSVLRDRRTASCLDASSSLDRASVSS